MRFKLERPKFDLRSYFLGCFVMLFLWLGGTIAYEKLAARFAWAVRVEVINVLRELQESQLDLRKFQ